MTEKQSDTDARPMESARVVVSDLDTDRPIATFFTKDGRELYSVELGRDGVSIEVRAWQTVRVNGVLWDNFIAVHPQSSNAVVVTRRGRWGDQPTAQEPRNG